MKCPDCHVEVKFHPEYCPHCGGALYGKSQAAAKASGTMGFKRFWFNAETN